MSDQPNPYESLPVNPEILSKEVTATIQDIFEKIANGDSETLQDPFADLFNRLAQTGPAELSDTPIGDMLRAGQIVEILNIDPQEAATEYGSLEAISLLQEMIITIKHHTQNRLTGYYSKELIPGYLRELTWRFGKPIPAVDMIRPIHQWLLYIYQYFLKMLSIPLGMNGEMALGDDIAPLLEAMGLPLEPNDEEGRFRNNLLEAAYILRRQPLPEGDILRATALIAKAIRELFKTIPGNRASLATDPIDDNLREITGRLSQAQIVDVAEGMIYTTTGLADLVESEGERYDKANQYRACIDRIIELIRAVSEEASAQPYELTDY